MEKLAEGVALTLEAAAALAEGNAVGGAAGGDGGFGLGSFGSPSTLGEGFGAVTVGFDLAPVRRAHRAILQARSDMEITGTVRVRKSKKKPMLRQIVCGSWRSIIKYFLCLNYFLRSLSR